jgi:hypothetical protein
VAEGFLDVFEVGAGGFEVARGAVPEVVKPDRWEPGTVDEFREAFADQFGVPGFAVGLGEEQAVAKVPVRGW